MSLRWLSLCSVALFVLCLLVFIPPVSAQETNDSTPTLNISDTTKLNNETLTEIKVDSVTTPEGGFVVIYNKGNVIGVSDLLGPGKHTDVGVNLSKPVNSSTTVIGLLYEDTNTNGTFESEWDLRYRINNEPVSEAAQISFVSPPEEEKTPEPSNKSNSGNEIDLKVVVAISLIPLGLFTIIGSYIYKRYLISQST